MDLCEAWYASDNNLRGTPHISQKKQKAGRLPTGRLSTAVLCSGLEKNGMVRAWHGHGMASVNQTRPHCVTQMGKTHSKPLAARHGRGTAWSRHGNGMLCMDRPLPWCVLRNIGKAADNAEVHTENVNATADVNRCFCLHITHPFLTHLESLETRVLVQDNLI